jgi:hypothetical protein
MAALLNSRVADPEGLTLHPRHSLVLALHQPMCLSVLVAAAQTRARGVPGADITAHHVMQECVDTAAGAAIAAAAAVCRSVCI